MRCLVTGAYGFIGQYVVRAMQQEGWVVVGAGRDLKLGRRLLPDIEWIGCDFNTDLDPETWRARLEGITAVANCVGILQSTVKDSADRIHRQGTIALFEAAAAADVRRLVHVSAMSAEANLSSSYATTKTAADTYLEELDLNWLIIKPSLVIARGSYGGTSLMRGLAGLPYILPIAGDGRQRMQPIVVQDLALGIARLAKIDKPVHTTLFAAGPDILTIEEIATKYRHWLGFPDAAHVHVPHWLLRPVFWLGDIAGWLGNATPMRSTSLKQLQYDETADSNPFAEASGLTLQPLASFFSANPATLQDRLHARLYFLRPILQTVLALFWILTGLITFVPSALARAVDVLLVAGFSPGVASSLVIIGAAVDIVLGILFLLPDWVRVAGALQLALSASYLAVLTVTVPGLWLDPLGTLLKVLPIMAATALVMALAEKR